MLYTLLYLWCIPECCFKEQFRTVWEQTADLSEWQPLNQSLILPFISICLCGLLIMAYFEWRRLSLTDRPQCFGSAFRNSVPAFQNSVPAFQSRCRIVMLSELEKEKIAVYNLKKNDFVIFLKPISTQYFKIKWKSLAPTCKN